MARFINHIISQGDTIQAIAQRYLGDMSLWTEIAEFNDLKYPYIVDTVNEKMQNPDHLATIGDTLLIRVSQDTQAELIANLKRKTEYDQEEIYGLALGKDLDIMPSSEDKVFDPEILGMKGDPKGAIATVKGLDNLKQALFIRLITPLGSYIGHPEFGSEVHKYIGMKNTEETATLLNLEIERTIRKDSRVNNVVYNNHVISGNTYAASFTVHTLDLDEAFEFVIAAQEEGIVMLDSLEEVY